MKGIFCLLLFCLAFFSLQAQTLFADNVYTGAYSLPSARKLYQRNTGAIVGLQRGQYTAIEFGYEAHWRKLSLRNPHITGATANLEYNFGHHVIGYKAGMWAKTGRVNLTYGGNLVYFNNFKGLNRYGIGPAVGFRLAGFHLINGYNILAGDKALPANTLYVTLRYYFPVDNKFTWDRKTMKKKRDRAKEKERRKKQRADEIQSGERKGLRKYIPF